MKKVQMHRNLYVYEDIAGKFKIRFTMPRYNYSEVLLLGLETAIANLKSGGD